MQCDKLPLGMAALDNAWFAGTSDNLRDALTSILNSCSSFETTLEANKPPVTSEYLTVVFLAKAPPGFAQAVVTHSMYRYSYDSATKKATLTTITTLPGIDQMTWLYITDDESDVPMSQLTLTHVDNPIFAQLGQLLGAVEKPFEKSKDADGYSLRIKMTARVKLPFRRSTIVEADNVGTVKRNSNGEIVDDKNVVSETPVYQQSSATVTVNNTPNTWIAVNAGAGFIVGAVHNDQRMKIDSKSYASDPLRRGVTFAGVTVHLPYDASQPSVSLREVFGIFVGAALTPTGGFVVGPSIGWRGLALVAGYAALLVQTAPAGKTAGSDASQSNPQLVNGRSDAWFAGGSYAFK